MEKKMSLTWLRVRVSLLCWLCNRRCKNGLVVVLFILYSLSPWYLPFLASRSLTSRLVLPIPFFFVCFGKSTKIAIRASRFFRLVFSRNELKCSLSCYTQVYNYVTLLGNNVQSWMRTWDNLETKINLATHLNYSFIFFLYWNESGWLRFYYYCTQGFYFRNSSGSYVNSSGAKIRSRSVHLFSVLLFVAAVAMPTRCRKE